MTSRRHFLRSFCAAIALAPALCRLAEKVSVAVPESTWAREVVRGLLDGQAPYDTTDGRLQAIRALDESGWLKDGWLWTGKPRRLT